MNGIFLQYFEGPFTAVDALYRDIVADDRHTGIVELLNRPIEQRVFPDWWMNTMASEGIGELLRKSRQEALHMMRDVLAVTVGDNLLGERVSRLIGFFMADNPELSSNPSEHRFKPKLNG